MAWQLLAIWILVGIAVAWFVRDEKRRAEKRLAEQSARHARARAFGRKASPGFPARLAASRPTGLTDVQRKFLEEYSKTRA